MSATSSTQPAFDDEVTARLAEIKKGISLTDRNLVDFIQSVLNDTTDDKNIIDVFMGKVRDKMTGEQYDDIHPIVLLIFELFNDASPEFHQGRETGPLKEEILKKFLVKKINKNKLAEFYHPYNRGKEITAQELVKNIDRMIDAAPSMPQWYVSPPPTGKAKSSSFDDKRFNATIKIEEHLGMIQNAQSRKMMRSLYNFSREAFTKNNKTPLFIYLAALNKLSGENNGSFGEIDAALKRKSEDKNFDIFGFLGKYKGEYATIDELVTGVYQTTLDDIKNAPYIEGSPKKTDIEMDTGGYL